MRYKIDHDLHNHSYLSSCSADASENAEFFLDYSRKNKLHTFAVTDHYWDSAVPTPSRWYAPQNYENISKILPLPKADGLNLIFGCETDMNWDMTIGVPKERYDDFSFIVVPTTHLQMTEFTIHPEDAASNKRRAELWVERFDALLSSSLPFYKTGVAHLACPLINKASREDYLKVLDLIPTEEMERLFTRAAQLGLGIEINKSDMSFKDNEADRVLRMFKVAKGCGCKFYLATDGHHPNNFENSHEIFERAVTLLELSETDKIDFSKIV